MARKVLNITVVSDNICPWCYVGKRQLDRALPLAKDRFVVNIKWEPYLLNADLPLGASLETKAMLASKFGGKLVVDRMLERLDLAGKPLGIDFKFNGLTSSTVPSHALGLAIAEEDQKLQHEVIEQIMRGYFEGSMDVGNFEQLADAVAKTGYSREKALEILQSGKLQQEVRQIADSQRRRGISGVPNFLINGKYQLSGAQPVEAWADLFDQLEKDPSILLEEKTEEAADAKAEANRIARTPAGEP